VLCGAQRFRKPGVGVTPIVLSVRTTRSGNVCHQVRRDSGSLAQLQLGENGCQTRLAYLVDATRVLLTTDTDTNGPSPSRSPLTGQSNSGGSLLSVKPK